MDHLRSLACVVFLCAMQPGIASAQKSQEDIAQRLDAMQTSIDDVSKKVDGNKGWSAKDWFASIGGVAALFAVTVSAITVWINRGMNWRTLTQKANEEKAKNLQERLDKFYDPLMQLRDQSRLLYQSFRSRQPDPDNFRTLTALLSGKKFEGNDNVLLDEIIKIGKETENLIKQLSGLVDNDLQAVLGKATTHYLVLRLAHQGLLRGDEVQFREYVYPRELDAAINQHVDKLKKDLAELRTGVKGRPAHPPHLLCRWSLPPQAP